MSQLPLWTSTPARRTSAEPLSKTRVLGGLQCLKRLYLETYENGKRDELDAGRQAILDTGRLVGRVARGCYPDGVAIDDDSRRHEGAVRQTAAALADPATRAIYEAAFTFADIRLRIDVLHRVEVSAWDLIEIKSSSGFKDEYLPDVAVQLHVAEGSGVTVRRALLLHVNSQYVWPGGAYDLEALFTAQDLTAEAREAIPWLLGRIESMRPTLFASEPPEIAVGPHCRKPYRCPFHDYCHEGGPEHHVTDLPKLSPKVYRALLAAAIEDIRDIPQDFDGLSDLQRRVRSCVLKGEPYAHPDLRPALEAIRYPVHFLDFETCNPPLPIIPGTRPFQQTPFQWSDHILEADGTVHHRGFLHIDRSDPCRFLTEALLEALYGEGSIVVYSGFEARVIRSLAEALPSHAGRLLPLIEHRIVDLHDLIHSHYYHPEFHGSFSIKHVLPALVEGLGYSDLAIQEGSQAALAFSAMTDPATPERRRGELRDALLAYCRRDTEAMLRLFQILKQVP